MNPCSLFRVASTSIGNVVRSTRRRGLGCVTLPVSGAYPEWPAPRPSLPFPLGVLVPFAREISQADMRTAMRMLGDDGRVRCVVLLFGPLHAGLSSLHGLRRLVLDLRAKGKRVVAWIPSAELSDYYLASACDEVLMPESGHLAALGLRAEVMFLKDALDLIGVEADLESIAEYKVTPDTFRRSSMSEPHREMLDGVVDSTFEHVVAAISDGRGIARSRVGELIDAMPMDAARAAEVGLVDAVLYEDEIPAHLAGKNWGTGGSDGRHPARLTTWQRASRWLRRPAQPRTRQVIGVVSVEGLMTMGRSRRSPAPLPLPFVQAQAGAETVIQALRQAEADRRIAAVILHVETPGGSALASDLICREVRRLRQRKPVVVLMGGQATSGGYYVSACADRIIARPTTMTGSIGVWGGKFVLGGLYRKLGVGSESVQRGAMAGLYSELEPFDQEQRSRMQRDLGDAYARFTGIVAEGRGMTGEKVEELARGRVWTGAQAFEAGLVDELGGYETALASAKELAGLDAEREYTFVRVHPGRHRLLPLPFPVEETSWQQALDGLRELARERVWAMSPWIVRIEG